MTPVGFVTHPALKTCRRWTASRKAGVVMAIRSGEITAEQAMRAHGLTADELLSWQRRFSRHGQGGLAALREQAVRA